MDSAPEQLRHRGGGGVVPPERTQVGGPFTPRRRDSVFVQ
jgi:hypothetical protein